MTPDECVRAFQARGFKAELVGGAVPFIPSAELVGLRRIKEALDISNELKLGADCWAEGIVLKLPSPARRYGARA